MIFITNEITSYKIEALKGMILLWQGYKLFHLEQSM